MGVTCFRGTIFPHPEMTLEVYFNFRVGSQ
jgi:hypothetical protein